MTPESPTDPRQALEASLTAMLLGELPEDQAAFLRRAIASDPELARMHERLKVTIGLVRETAATPLPQTEPQAGRLKLSEERRQELLQRFKTVEPKEFSRKGRRVVLELAVAAGLVAVLGSLMLPSLSKSKSRSQNVAFRTWGSAPSSLAVNEAARRDDWALTARPKREATEVEQLRRLSSASPSRAPTAKPAQTTIVLPATSELADANVPPTLRARVESPAEVKEPLGAFPPKDLSGLALSGGGGAGIAPGSSGSAGPVPALTTWSANPNAGYQLNVTANAAGDKPPAVASPAAGPAPELAFQGAPPAPTLPALALREGEASRPINSTASSPPAALPPELPAPVVKGTPKDVSVVGALRARFGSDAATAAAAGSAKSEAPISNDIDPNTGLPIPVDSVAPGGAPLYTRFYKLDPNASKREEGVVGFDVGAIAESNSQPGAQGGITAGSTINVPRAQMAGSVFGGGTGGQGTQDQNRALGFDWQLGNIPTNNAAMSAQGGIALPSVNQADKAGLSADEQTKLPVLGQVPVAGKLFRSESNIVLPMPGGEVATYNKRTTYRMLSQLETPQPAGQNALSYQNNASAAHDSAGHERSQGTPSNVESLGVVGYVNVPMNVTNAGAFTFATGDRLLANNDGKQELAGAEKNLQDLKRFEMTLSERIASEKTDLDLPKSSMVQIIDRAEPAQKPSIGEKVRSALGGEVARKARVKIERDRTDIQGLSSPSQLGAYDPYFVQSEFETIQSEPVLGRVVKDLHLDEEFAKEKGAPVSTEEAVTMLKKQLDLKTERGTDIVDIGVKSKSSEQAARIANAVSDAYLNYRAEARKQQTSGGIEALNQQLTQENTRIAAAESNVDYLRIKLNIPDAVAAGDAPTLSQENIPPGMIDSRGMDVKQALAIYAELANKTLLRPSNIPTQSSQIQIQTDQPLSRAEATKLLEKELAKRGVSVVSVGDKFIQGVPAPQGGSVGAPIADAAPPKPATPLPEPQPEIQTRENAFSTFSMNVSDVSFKLAAASLEKGVLPDPGSIRSEEFINAFDYRDPEPAAGTPVSFAWERGQYPFAQGRDLLRFSIKTAAQGRQPGRPLNLVLLLDNSGSMERADRVQIIHEALRVLATQLSAQDVFSVVTFARTPRLWVDGVPGSQAGQVAEEVSGLTPQGGTNLGDALDLAYQTALRHYLANGINRVVLLTDGAANLGDVDPNSLKTKVEANRKQGIALDCFGIGWEGYNDDLLEMLTRNADGRYGFLNTPEEAATQFAGQLAGALRMAANDVKVQVEFNPNRVTAYRQIGYAKLQLTKEQFRDNTVNAAQIGAAESGNALYVIDVNGGGDGPLATVRVRYRVPGTAEYREQEWTVPYTGTAVPLEQSSPALRLAATTSAFSEWLATSPYAGEVTPDGLLDYLSGIPQVYGADTRPQKLEWMIRQAKSLVGK